MMRVTAQLEISPRQIFLTLLGIETILLLVDALAACCMESRDLRDLLDITLESNLPTWFASTQALAVGGCAYLLSRIRGQQGLGARRVGWLIVSVFFVYIAIDDSARIHERVATTLSDLATESGSEHAFVETFLSFPSYYWQLVFAPVFGFMGLFMVVFLYREFIERKLLWQLVLGLGCYALAVGLDYFDGIASNYDIIVRNGPYTLEDARHIFRALEEYIEMVGTSLILVAFVAHWGSIQSATD